MGWCGAQKPALKFSTKCYHRKIGVECQLQDFVMLARVLNLEKELCGGAGCWHRRCWATVRGLEQFQIQWRQLSESTPASLQLPQTPYQQAKHSPRFQKNLLGWTLTHSHPVDWSWKVKRACKIECREAVSAAATYCWKQKRFRGNSIGTT